MTVAVKCPLEHASKIQHVISGFGKVGRQEWGGSSLYASVEIPAGVQEELFSKLNGITHGHVEIKVVRSG